MCTRVDMECGSGPWGEGFLKSKKGHERFAWFRELKLLNTGQNSGKKRKFADIEGFEKSATEDYDDQGDAEHWIPFDQWWREDKSILELHTKEIALQTWELMQTEEDSTNVFKQSKKGVILLYRYRGEQGLTGTRVSHSSGTFRKTKVETEQEIKECREAAAGVHARWRRENVKGPIMDTIFQPEINVSRIQNLYQNNKTFKDVLVAVVVKEIIERRKSAEIDEERKNRAVLEVEDWWEQYQMERKMAAKANISVDELVTQVSVSLGTYKAQLSSTIEAQYAKNVALTHQVDQNFADVKPTEIQSLLDELQGYRLQ